jgi:ribosome recycling factor
MVTRVNKFAEEARVAIRNVRRDANKHTDVAEKDKVLTEDEAEATKEKIQELTKNYEGVVNTHAAAKEKDVMEE